MKNHPKLKGFIIFLVLLGCLILSGLLETTRIDTEEKTGVANFPVGGK